MQLVTDDWWKSVKQHALVWSLAAGLGISLVAGCSNKPATPAGNQASTEEPADKGGEEPKDAPVSKTTSGRGKTMASTSKRPMIGDIPLDVWFENPLAVSKQAGDVAPPTKTNVKTPEPTVAKTVPATEPPPETPKASGAGGSDWASVISIEDLQDETKQIRLDLQKHLASVQIYNGHYKDDILSDGTVLSAMAAIALVHPEKVSWKDHAAQVRDLAVEMTKKAKGLGQKPFDETKKEFEKIDGLLSGNPPPGLEEAAADIPFSEVVSRRGIMKRLQTASDSLRANYQTEASLTKGQDEAAHMATVVAALSKIISTEGYPDADADEYKNFAKGLMEANLTMAKAARDKDFAAFSEANGRVGKFCSECHGAYQSSSN